MTDKSTPGSAALEPTPVTAVTEWRVMCVPPATGKPTIWCRSAKEFVRRDFEQASKERAEGRYTDVWIESRIVTVWRRDHA